VSKSLQQFFKEEKDMLIKRIISTAAILGVMAAFAVAGSPVFADCNEPLKVTAYGNYNNSSPAHDKLIPGTGPIEGNGEGF
jgi:predicted cobalt transporter CbtA